MNLRSITALTGIIASVVIFSINPSLLIYKVASITVLMATLWMTELIPIAVTSLIPIVAFPLMEITTIEVATAPYGNKLIYLFMGGFLLALAMEESLLHKRLALYILKIFGTNPHSLLIGFMVCCYTLSMWMTNTATTMMMLPIGLAICEMLEGKDRSSNFTVLILLAIAYSSTAGGLATLVGTVPNAFMAAFYEQTTGESIDFISWIKLSLPLSLIIVFMIYYILKTTFRIDPSLHDNHHELENTIKGELAGLGAMSRHEKIVMCVFSVVVFFWTFSRPVASYFGLKGLNDSSIAMAGAIILFCLPIAEGKRALDWHSARKLPWGIFLLFGGGLSLAKAIEKSGLSALMGDGLSTVISNLNVLPYSGVLVILAAVTLIVFLTEITSNTATTATFLPIMAATATASDLPHFFLLYPVTIAASCAFMLPVATPPNAIVFGSERVPMNSMIKAGFWINLACITTIGFYTYFFI